MASQNFKTPTQLAQDYLTTLQVLKPSVNTAQQDSDWWIRSRVVGGFAAGVYADQRAISNDPFPQSARHEGLGKLLAMFLNRDFISPQASDGNAAVTGTPGSVLSVGLQLSYLPNGNSYQVVSNVTIPSGGVALVPVQSVGTGQSQNLLSGAPLTIASPPAGINGNAVASGNIADGRDMETDPEAATAILTFIQSPVSGGTATDYKQWAAQADPTVVAASVNRFAFGLGTVEVIITAGTTDIDTALNNGDPVILEPSDALVAIVQAYIDTKRPVTDCVQVVGPTGINVNVTVNVTYINGVTGSTILSNQTLTCDQLVQREVQRAIYKNPPGGRQINGNGYLLASEIEQVIDLGLSSEAFESGIYAQILLDRQVIDLSGQGTAFILNADQLATPATITVVSQES